MSTLRVQRNVKITGAVALLLTVAALVWPASPARAEESADSAQQVFAAIAAAWDQEQVQTLADLIHADGLRVSTGGDYDRFTRYSPSQAFYYFQNLFQTHATVDFTLQRLPDAGAGDRVHGMGIWRHRRQGSETPQELRLVLVLARQGELWRLAEITTITVR